MPESSNIEMRKNLDNALTILHIIEDGGYVKGFTYYYEERGIRAKLN